MKVTFLEFIANWEALIESIDYWIKEHSKEEIPFVLKSDNNI